MFTYKKTCFNVVGEIKYIVKFGKILSTDHVLDDPIFHQTCYSDDI